MNQQESFEITCSHFEVTCEMGRENRVLSGGRRASVVRSRALILDGSWAVDGLLFFFAFQEKTEYELPGANFVIC